MHFQISSSLNFKRKNKRHVFLLLFVLIPVHLTWPSYATGKCYRSPRQLISTMKHWWLYITIHSLTIFKWKMRNLRLNLIYLSFFVQYIITFTLRWLFGPFRYMLIQNGVQNKNRKYFFLFFMFKIKTWGHNVHKYSNSYSVCLSYLQIPY